MKKFFFVQLREELISDLDQRELKVYIKEFDSEHNHIHDNFILNIAINPNTNMQEAYEKIAKSLKEFADNGKIHQIVFDTQVIYDREGNIARTRNTYGEKIRLAFEELYK